MIRKLLNWLFPPKTSVRYWKARAKALRSFNTGIDNCFHQAKLLSGEMKKEGLYHYIVDGHRYRDGEWRHHNWVQYQGEIFDPAQDDRNPNIYRVTERIQQ
jgi:hypothetical protein